MFPTDKSIRTHPKMMVDEELATTDCPRRTVSKYIVSET